MQNTTAYRDGKLKLNVLFDNETVWLKKEQMAQLLGKKTDTINSHICNVYKDGEVNVKDGKKIIKNVEYYNLDMIISIGYRVKSLKGVKFRQWALLNIKKNIKKNIKNNCPSINKEKIMKERLSKLENDINFIKSNIKNNTLDFKRQIFFEGSHFDAHSFIVSLIRNAKTSITLIDNYIDNTTLTMLSNNKKALITLVSSSFSKELNLDIQRYNKQYKSLEIRKNKTFHDRYLIIDKTKVYNIGTSLKSVGAKTFTISLLDDFCENTILKRKR